MNFWNNLTEGMRSRMFASRDVDTWDEHRKALEYINSHSEAINFGILAYVHEHPERSAVVSTLKTNDTLRVAFERAAQKMEEISLPNKRAVATWNSLSESDKAALRTVEPKVEEWLNSVSTIDEPLSEGAEQTFLLHLDTDSQYFLQSVLEGNGAGQCRIYQYSLQNGTHAYLFCAADQADLRGGEAVYQGELELSDHNDGSTPVIMRLSAQTPPPQELLNDLKRYLESSNLDQYELSDC
jgi:hypothetical protein